MDNLFLQIEAKISSSENIFCKVIKLKIPKNKENFNINIKTKIMMIQYLNE